MRASRCPEVKDGLASEGEQYQEHERDHDRERRDGEPLPPTARSHDGLEEEDVADGVDDREEGDGGTEEVLRHQVQ